MRYFITFACYGAHLHGDESGSVDRNHNVPGGRLVEANPARVAVMRQQMDQAAYLLEALREVCFHRGWGLRAALEVRPEKVMNAFKSYASRGLNRLGNDGPERKRWARHGSTRWLWKDEDVQEAIRYVVSGQGEPMEVYLGDLL